MSARTLVSFGPNQGNETASIERFNDGFAILLAHQLQLLRVRGPDWNHHSSIAGKLLQ
jgi:hypothetical protein